MKLRLLAFALCALPLVAQDKKPEAPKLPVLSDTQKLTLTKLQLKYVNAQQQAQQQAQIAQQAQAEFMSKQHDFCGETLVLDNTGEDWHCVAKKDEAKK